MCNKVRRLFRITFCAVVSIFILLSISSCSDLFFDALRNSTSNTGETVTFTGSINIGLSDGGALPEEYTRLISSNANHRENTYARYAIPTFPDSTPDSTPTTIVTASATGEDTITQDITDNTGDTFTIGLKTGKVWTVTVTRTYSGGISLSDSATLDLTTNQVASHDFVLKPDTSGTGNIELYFIISDDRIHYFTVDIENQDQIIYSKNIYSGKWNLEGSSRWIQYPSISIGSINSGVHRAVLRFYRNQDDDDKVLLCTLAQDINVFKDMTTNKWVTSNGDMVDDLEITETMVNSLPMKQIFVGNCGTGTATPSDSTGTGSPYSPFATLSRAIYAVSMLPGKDADDNTIPYTIHVKDGQTESWTSGKSIDNTHNVTIECWENTVGDKLGTATVFWNGESNGTLLYVYGTLTIEGEKSEGENPTWSGLVLDGNKSGEHPASGISCDGGVLNLRGGGIQNCSYARTGAGAVYGVALEVEAGGTVNMSGGKIQQNTAGLYSGSYGAIYIASGADPYISTFNMTDGMICDNEHSSTNGYLPGIYISSGRFNMSGGEISRNIYRGELTGGGKGGAVYLYNSQNAVFNMSGGKLVGNVSGDGGAVYANGSAKFYISGSAYIPAGNSNGTTGRGKNDVSISNKLYIAGTLTTSGKVVTITPEEYESPYIGYQIIDVTEDSETSVSAECGKFAVTPDSSTGKNYVVNSEGKIEEKPVINATASNIIDVINGMTESGEISISGTFSDDDFTALHSTLYDLQGYSSDPEIKVTLDLSGVTGLTSLSSGAFDDLRNLKEIILPEGLEEISSGSFWACDGLERLYIPASVTSFTGLYYCSRLESVTIAPGNTSYYVDEELKTVFSSDGKKIVLCFGRNTIEEYNIPDAVEEICNYAFDRTSFARIKSSSNSHLTTIGNLAFEACQVSDYIVLPSTVSTIGSSFFQYYEVTVKYRGTEAQKDNISFNHEHEGTLNWVCNYTGD